MYFAWVLGVFSVQLFGCVLCAFILTKYIVKFFDEFLRIVCSFGINDVVYWLLCFKFWVVRIFPVLLENFELHNFCCVLHSPFSCRLTMCNMCIWALWELHTSQWSSIDSFSVYLFLLLNHTNIHLVFYFICSFYLQKVFPFILMPFKIEFVFRFVCLSKRTVILYYSIFRWPTRTFNLQKPNQISFRFTFIYNYQTLLSLHFRL